MTLNPSQQAAVEHRGSPLLVLAGAGTGKTRVITHRVASLVAEGVPPWQILAVTFTNKAAGEMRRRIEHLVDGREDVRSMWVGTFHAIGARILRQMGEPVGVSSSFSIYDVDDQISVMGRVIKEMDLPERLYTPRSLLGHVDRAKNRGLGPDDLSAIDMIEPVREVVTGAYRRYEARLRAANAVDFGDLLLLVVKLLREAPPEQPGTQLGQFDPVARLRRRFSHIVVDEFQDTNPVQVQLVDALGAAAELCVVGDDDQAIYGWRGAEVEQILSFPDRHPGTEVVRLEQNYRSTTRILSCADALIRRNVGRLGKTLFSELGPGAPVRVLVGFDEREEARRIAREVASLVAADVSPEEVAIFYRTHAQSRVIEDEVRRAGLHCRIVGGVAFYERLEVKDLLAYMTLLVNPSSDVHLLRVINRPARGVGKTSVERLQALASAQKISLWEALAQPEEAGLGRAPARRVHEFRHLLLKMFEELQGRSLDEVAAEILERTGYRESLALDGGEEAVARLENLQELLGNLAEFCEERPDATIQEYLELVALVTGEQGGAQPGGSVTLMTIHSAKGLEFDHVYLTGLEEGIFPHSRVLEDPRQLEEERRLAYVAVTRARRVLTLTLVQRRRLYGQVHVNPPSRFVGDLPGDVVWEGDRRRDPAALRHSAEPQWDDDIVYDAEFQRHEGADAHPDIDGDAQGEGQRLFVGMAVRHARFGEGEVIGWSGGGRDLKLQLRFPGVGTKTILARFCEPA